MFKKIKNKIESKRDSDHIFWKSLIFLKDFFWVFWRYKRELKKGLFKYDNLLFKFLNAPKQFGGRFINLSHAAPKANNALPHIIEFGVCTGETINHLANIFYPEIIWGFDSFEGLPEDWQKNRRVVRRKGHLAVNEMPNVKKNVKLVKGWFKDTIPLWLDKHPGDIRFLHIDSDLYSSAKTVLSLMNSRIKKNTIIVFDELCDFNSDGKFANWEQHEWKALREWMKAFNRKIKVLSRGGESAAIRVIK
jgi:hypothetical protein